MHMRISRQEIIIYRCLLHNCGMMFLLIFVKGVTLSSDRKSFTVNLDGRPGNAVIAIYDKDDPKREDAKILWSFHIWVTEVKEQHLGMNVKGNSYTVLDRNLGATSVIPGERSSIGLLYQWGRKDPFVGTGEYGKNSNAKMYNEVGEVAFATVKGGESTGNVKYAIQNPTKFIMYSRVKSNTANPPYYCAYDWLYYADWALWGNQRDILIRKHPILQNLYMTRVQKVIW